MVKSSNVSKRISTNMVPLIVSFFAGFIVNRLMNHQDVITGDVTEGMQRFWIDLLNLISIILFFIGGLLMVVGFFETVNGLRQDLRGDINLFSIGLGLVSVGAIIWGEWVTPRHEDGQLSGLGWKWITRGLVGLGILLFIVIVNNFIIKKSILHKNANPQHTEDSDT